MRNFSLLQRHGLLFASFLISLLALLFSLLLSTQANAVSIYDDALRTTESLYVKSLDGTQNFTSSEEIESDYYWEKLLFEPNDSNCISYGLEAGYLAAKESGYVSVSQRVGTSSEPYGQASITVMLNTTSTLGNIFFAGGGGTDQRIYVESMTYDVTLYVDNDGNMQQNCSYSGFDNQSNQISNNWLAPSLPNWNMYLYYSNVPVTYPEDYEGDELPDSPPSPVEDNISQPDILISSLIGFDGQFSDTNFYTIDTVPFTCDGFVPQLNVEVWTTHGAFDEELLYTTTSSASSPFSYTFPTEMSTKEYRIVSYYSCPEYNFTEVSFYDFAINAGGGLVYATPCSAEYFCSLGLPTYGLTEVILSPLAFISKLPNATCTPLVLPMPHGMVNIELPCMTPILSANFNEILTIYQTVITGLFAYYVSIRLFGNVKAISNPRDDQVETVRL